MPKDSCLLLCGLKHAKIKFCNDAIAILYKYMLYLITKVFLGIYL